MLHTRTETPTFCRLKCKSPERFFRLIFAAARAVFPGTLGVQEASPWTQTWQQELSAVAIFFSFSPTIGGSRQNHHAFRFLARHSQTRGLLAWVVPQRTAILPRSGKTLLAPIRPTHSLFQRCPKFDSFSLVPRGKITLEVGPGPISVTAP